MFSDFLVKLHLSRAKKTVMLANVLCLFSLTYLGSMKKGIYYNLRKNLAFNISVIIFELIFLT